MIFFFTHPPPPETYPLSLHDALPICDARLPDGSRVNVIAPPLALDGPTLTIRKFKKDKLTMKNLVEYASISPEGARVRSEERRVGKERRSGWEPDGRNEKCRTMTE